MPSCHQSAAFEPASVPPAACNFARLVEHVNVRRRDAVAGFRSPRERCVGIAGEIGTTALRAARVPFATRR